ncbi:type II toxin-antitoxin system VapC family toxin [Rhizobium rhizogenes]|uniref:type II toxin-antitoxin system VapC family toxin n=1 Tax=Rhizobium rhizogenes TaxID=359 RepID=UPI0006476F87|nr:type II toxin-antitoxin system VapC family toxin [Rhizobium rhizogenes]
MIVLDTNVVSEITKANLSPNIGEWFERQDMESLYLCSPILMELSYGAEKVLPRDRSERFFEGFDYLMRHQFAGRILQLDQDSALLTGRIRARRERIGHQISVQDAMIAAVCLIHGATLATRNIKDFQGLDIRLVNPFEGGSA